MLIADTKLKKRVFIRDAVNAIPDTYYCPVCKQELVIRNGLVKFPHFAHKKGSLAGSECDSFKPLFQTEWYTACLQEIPQEYVEPIIVNERTRERHLADACTGHTVFLFLDGDLTSKEFDKRNTFYQQSGYRVVWLVNMVPIIQNKHLKKAYPLPFDYHWEEYYKTFKNLDLKKISIYMEFKNPDITTGERLIDRLYSMSANGIQTFSIAGEYITSLEEFLQAASSPTHQSRNRDNITLLRKNIYRGTAASPMGGQEKAREEKKLGEPDKGKSYNSVSDWMAAGNPPAEYLMHASSFRKHPFEIRHPYPTECPYKDRIEHDYDVCDTCPFMAPDAPLPPHIHPYARYTICTKKGSSIPLEPGEKIISVMHTPEGIIQAVQTERNGKTKIRQFSIGEPVGRTLSQLWDSKTARMRVQNLKTGWRYQINRDPKEMMEKYRGKVYAEKICPPDGDNYFKPSEGKNEIWDANKPLWLLEWKAQN